jgi:hypothetical protein
MVESGGWIVDTIEFLEGGMHGRIDIPNEAAS